MPETSCVTLDDYCIPRSYRIRAQNAFHDDSGYKDEWQREVYLYARGVMQAARLRTIYDVGCGSGFKLVKYLSDFDFVGFDLEPTVSFLQRTYPDRRWEVLDLQASDIPPADLVICADVIEHILNPDQIVHFIKRVISRYAVISTPDRNLAYRTGSPYLQGPPENECHVREWSFNEFTQYLSREFTLLDHCVTNFSQATQLALCVARG